jgi:hypothetical protein
MLKRLLSCVIFIPVIVAQPARAQEERAFRDISSEKIEGILKELKITFEKSKDKTPGDFFYDFEHNGLKFRLHNYGGRDLWIDAQFSDKLPLEMLNAWNTKARFTRAVLLKDTVSVEYQIDCSAGTSDAIIRQFIQRFQSEAAEFVKFVAKK